MTEKEERLYIDAQNKVWQDVMATAMRHLGYPKRMARLYREADMRSALRTLCRDYDLDNSWDDDIYLVDVINNYVAKSLEEKLKT